jgi:hypothetical protein
MQFGELKSIEHSHQVSFKSIKITSKELSKFSRSDLCMYDHAQP